LTNTKKFLSAFDPRQPQKGSSDFLIPLLRNGHAALWGLSSHRIRPFGCVVYLGRSISIDDVLDKIAKAEDRPEMDSVMSSMLLRYMSLLGTVKIGNVVRLSESPSDVFDLEIVAQYPAAFRSS
jgi:hypothetical protein